MNSREAWKRWSDNSFKWKNRDEEQNGCQIALHRERKKKSQQALKLWKMQYFRDGSLKEQGSVRDKAGQMSLKSGSV